jgi:hypothetical protein
MQPNENKKQRPVLFRLSDEEYNKLKIACLVHKSSLQKILENLVVEYIRKQ